VVDQRGFAIFFNILFTNSPAELAMLSVGVDFLCNALWNGCVDKKRWMMATDIKTRSSFLKGVIRESAKIGFPGRMAGGRGPLVGQIKKRTIEFFLKQTFEDFKSGRPRPSRYRAWHEKLSNRFANGLQDGSLGVQVRKKKSPFAIGAKFVDTFIHQLIRYPEYSKLYPAIYLPLDRKVTPHLRKNLTANDLLPRGGRLSKCLNADKIYELEREDYYFIQAQLSELTQRIAIKIGRPNMARIELNILWAVE